VANLELDAIGTRLDRGIDQFLRQFERAIMVVAHFSDDEGAFGTDGETTDVQLIAIHWILVRQEVTPLDSNRKLLMVQPSACTLRVSAWRCWGCTKNRKKPPPPAPSSLPPKAPASRAVSYMWSSVLSLTPREKRFFSIHTSWSRRPNCCSSPRMR